MALTVDTLLAAIRTVRALHLPPHRLDLRDLQSRLEEAAKLAIETSQAEIQ